MKRKVVPEIILTLLLTSMLSLAFNIRPVKAEPTVIVIDEPEYTWYGDLIVNETDTVIIENCNFTVENGMIYVYGTMNVINSTIWMRHVSSKRKYVYVHGNGNFTMSNSTILKENAVRAKGNSHVSILNSSSPTTRFYTFDNSNVYVYNSAIYGIHCYGGNSSLLDSDCLSSFFRHYDYDATFFASNSNISRMSLVLLYSGNVEIRHGLVEELTIVNTQTSANFTLVNSYVDDWWINCQLSGKLLNSIIDTLSFWVDSTWSGNLTLSSGYIDYLEMNCAVPSFVLENSTVYGWHTFIGGESSIQVSNSENIELGVFDFAEVSILNSTVPFLCTYEDFFGILLATNTTIETANIRLVASLQNLTLEEGFHEFFDLYIPERGCNITLVDSVVDHWRINALENSTLNLFNSTLTKDSLGGCPYNLEIFGNSSCYVYNSNFESILCSGSTYYHSYPSLTIVNCTIDTLYAYTANVTAVNSTVRVLITDPIQVELINSRILLWLDFSFEMTSEDSITTSFSEECDPPLPEDIQRFSQYINITTAYDDYFEVQVVIYYNETEVEEAGIDEARLQMYYLDESNVWQPCSIQGVNTVENYVWANVTRFSYFVVGASVLTPQDALNNLVEDVEAMNLQQGIENSLDTKLTNALASLEALNADKRNDAVNKLSAFINEVEAQRGNKITNEQADNLIAEAQGVIDLIELT